MRVLKELLALAVVAGLLAGFIITKTLETQSERGSHGATQQSDRN